MSDITFDLQIKVINLVQNKKDRITFEYVKSLELQQSMKIVSKTANYMYAANL